MENYVFLYNEINVLCLLLLVLIAIYAGFAFDRLDARNYFIHACLTLGVFFMSDSLWYTLDRGVIRNTFVANYF